jgi:protein SCO1/2
MGFCSPSLLSILLLAGTNAPPPAVQEVGIDEKLGATIDLKQPLRGEDGSPVTLAGLVDKPTLLTLNYFGCPGLCTAQLQGVVDVLNRTRAVPGKDFQVVTVSFDPRDTPEIATQKRLNYFQEFTRPVPLPAWRFLTGGQSATKALADAVGFRFKAQNADFIHPAAIIVLSPRGQVTRYLYGVSYLPADLEMAVQEAAQGQARPTINRILSICFSYDPTGRRYVFQFTRVAALLTLVAAAGFVLVLKRRAKVGA